MKKLFKAFTAVMAATLLSAPAASFAQSGAAPLKFKWGIPAADYYALFVAKDQGLFKEVGLDPEIMQFQSGAPLLAGLKSESLDVISSGLATVFALGQNIPLKLIYWEIDSAAGEALIVNSKSGINSIQDLPKAKAIGAPSGTCAQVSMVLIAKKLGAKLSDFNVINIAPPLYGNALASGGIDAGIAWAPYSGSLEASGHKAVQWATDYSPESGVCPVLTGVRPAFLTRHPDLGMKLVQVKAKAMEMIKANPQLGVDALVKNLGITKEVAKAAFDREFPKIPTLEQQVDKSSHYSLTNAGGLAKKLKIASEALAEAGSIPAPLSDKAIADAIDPSHIQRYLKEKK